MAKFLNGSGLERLVALIKQALSGKQDKKFVINITRKGSHYTYGKTYAEIMEAYESGADIEVHEGWSYYVYKLTNYDEDSGIFAFVSDSYTEVLDRYWWTVDSEDNWNTDETLYQIRLISGTTIKTINNQTLLEGGNLTLQPTLVSGTNIKTINNQSLLGSGNITISGGNSNIPVVAVTGNTPTQQLTSNTFYKFTGSITSLTVTLGSEIATIVNIYAFSFSAGQDNPTIILPSGVECADTPDIKSGDYVEFSIMDGKAVAKVWRN